MNLLINITKLLKIFFIYIYISNITKMTTTIIFVTSGQLIRE